ncbi:MAG: hypothetical protein ACFFBZ_04845, partial [Promethearchaeota archaeon]
MINTSKKYEHRINHLKDHQHDKEGKPHQKEIKPYSRNSKVGQLKKDEKKFHEKIEKSKRTW